MVEYTLIDHAHAFAVISEVDNFLIYKYGHLIRSLQDSGCMMENVRCLTMRDFLAEICRPRPRILDSFWFQTCAAVHERYNELGGLKDYIRRMYD